MSETATTPLGAFEAFMEIAFPWLPGHSADYRNLRAAFEAGHNRGLENAASVADCMDLSIMSSTEADMRARRIAAAIRSMKVVPHDPR